MFVCLSPGKEKEDETTSEGENEEAEEDGDSEEESQEIGSSGSPVKKKAKKAAKGNIVMKDSLKPKYFYLVKDWKQSHIWLNRKEDR